jgi:hypothetical protein
LAANKFTTAIAIIERTSTVKWGRDDGCGAIEEEKERSSWAEEEKPQCTQEK